MHGTNGPRGPALLARPYLDVFAAILALSALEAGAQTLNVPPSLPPMASPTPLGDVHIRDDATANRNHRREPHWHS